MIDNQFIGACMIYKEMHSQKGFAHLLLLILLLMGLGVGLYLVTQTQIFKPKASESSINQGLVGYWKFDEASGSAVIDSSGNNNNGTWKGTLGNQWASGKYGNAGKFVLAYKNTVVIPDSQSLSLKDSLTISAWVKRNLAVSYSYGILSKGNLASGASNTSYGLFLNANNQYAMRVSGNGTSSANISSSKTYPDTTEWHHIVGVYNGTNNGKSLLDIYIDGSLAGKQVTNAPSPLFIGNSNLTIGSTSINNSNYTWYWDGLIDEVRLYNRALSPAEVNELYKLNINPNPGNPACYVGKTCGESCGSGGPGVCNDCSGGWCNGGTCSTCQPDAPTPFVCSGNDYGPIENKAQWCECAANPKWFDLGSLTREGCPQANQPYSFDEFVAAFGSAKGDTNYNRKYDFNTDGRISITDYSGLVDKFDPNSFKVQAPYSVASFIATMGKVKGDAGFDATYDLNQDGRITVLDYSILMTKYGVTSCTPCIADINKDGRVSSLDYSTAVTCVEHGINGSDNAGNLCTVVDIDKNNLLDNNDTACIQSQFGKLCSNSN